MKKYSFFLAALADGLLSSRPAPMAYGQHILPWFWVLGALIRQAHASDISSSREEASLASESGENGGGMLIEGG